MTPNQTSPQPWRGLILALALALVSQGQLGCGGDQAPDQTPPPSAAAKDTSATDTLELAGAPLGPLPPRTAPNARLTELGKMLFHDKRLSGNASMSCATCHDPDRAWTDGVALGTAYPDSQGIRNTPTLLNAVYNRYYYWDARLTGKDKQTQVRDMITESAYMNMDGRLMLERLKQVPEYVALFNETLGGEPSFGRTLKAIAAYEETLVTSGSPFDKGELDEAATRGLALFEGKAGCVACHSGPYFSDSEAHHTGVADHPDLVDDPNRHFTLRAFAKFMGVDGFENIQQDPGFYIVTKDDDDRRAFRTPTLREVARTAPYMHSGVYATLAEVVEHYDRGEGGEIEPLGLSDDEKTDLVAFLESLSGDLPDTSVPEIPPYQSIADWKNQDN